MKSLLTARRTAAAGLVALLWLGSAGAAVASTGADGPNDVTVSGIVEEIVVDPVGEFTADAPEPNAGEAAGALTTELFVDVSGTLIDLPPLESPSTLTDGQAVSVTLTVPDGMSADAALAELATADETQQADASVVEVTAVVPAAAANPAGEAGADATLATVGQHHLTILPVYWSARDAANLASLRTVADQTAQFWSDQSNGQLSITTTVNDWAQIADPGTCNVTTLFNAALAAHQQAAPSGLRDHVVVYFPYRADCGGWAGLGSVNGSRVWVNGYPRADVVAHEIGHNLGLGHANQLTCTSGGAAVPLSDSCTVREYYDGADVMGYSTGQIPGSLNTALATGLGFVQTVDASPTATVTVDLAALTQPSQVRALRIPTWDGIDLYVDFRPATGRDVRTASWAGVQVHRRVPSAGAPTSQLVNMQASTGSGLESMRPGSVYAIPRSDYTLTTVSVGPTSARVQVTPNALTPAATPPPAANATPIANLDALTTTANTITFAGWALDPDTTNPIDVHIYIDGTVRAITADLSRPDVAAAFGHGDRHGFSTTIATTPGNHAICVYAINTPAGDNPMLRCTTVTAANATPIANLDALTTTANTITFAGWALDPDTTNPIDVHIYIDGTVRAITADLSRPDVAAAFGHGDRHGFSTTIATTPGNHAICVYAINTPAGDNPMLRCTTVTAANATPIANLDALTTTANTITFAGWALDPDTTNPIDVHIYIDGTVRAITADLSRPDVAAAFGHGDRHGFSTTIATTPGNHAICVYAINTPAGDNPMLRCTTVTAANATPIANLDALTTTANTITFAGWALDPDTTNPIDVHIYIDGTVRAITADLSRPDVAAAFGHGDRHGFSTTIATTPGNHAICVYAINTPAGDNPMLRCTTVTAR
ncbi:hypothetical protein [Pengzhenrongella phosphoraccumulans]|uniref:hypothetical protein n=1 Tax=Pengzhenrongella phosphoraccumulans TaxID=3114394 RepID=UPI00388F02E8